KCARHRCNERIQQVVHGYEFEIEHIVVEHNQHQCTNCHDNSGDTRHAKAWQHENLDSDQSHADKKGDDFPVVGKSVEIVGDKVKDQRDQRHQPGEAKSGRLHFKVDSAYDHQDENAADDRIEYKADNLFCGTQF